ncbi:MAG TPA: GNAT family N-acetyltransferase [Anaerolineae bacterium]|nr:GNAT family N-acetyltransferase [Anaerolineae bacterium]
MKEALAEFTLRTFRFPEDYQAVYDLWSRAGPGIQLRKSDEPEEIAKKLQRDPDLFLVAEAEGRIIGAVMGGFDGRRGLIYHLAVDPAFRRRGIGSTLMAELERRLVAKGCLRAYLLVTEENQETMAFYRRLGVGDHAHGDYGEDFGGGAMRVAILTVSDRAYRGEREDLSGPALAEAVRAHGWEVAQTAVLPDELGLLRDTLAAWADGGAYDIILTTGGTGFAPRDVTPEATLAVVEKQAPGLAEAMRAASLQVTPHAMLSRAVAGIRGRTLIVNLPGSPKAAVENLAVIAPVLPHAVQLLREAPEAEAGHHHHHHHQPKGGRP